VCWVYSLLISIRKRCDLPPFFKLLFFNVLIVFHTDERTTTELKWIFFSVILSLWWTRQQYSRLAVSTILGCCCLFDFIHIITFILTVVGGSVETNYYLLKYSWSVQRLSSAKRTSQ
jgi:predicted membrane protein